MPSTDANANNSAIRRENSFHFRTNLRLFLNFAMVAMVTFFWAASSLALYLSEGFNRIPATNIGAVLLLSATAGIYFSRWAIVALLIVLLPGKLLYKLIFAALFFSGEAALASLLTSVDDTTLMMMPTMVLAFAIPFEFARVVLDGRIEVDWFDRLEPAKLSIKGLFIRVTAIAIFLGIMRAVINNEVVQLAIFGVTTSVIGMLVLVPFSVKFASSRYRFLWVLGMISVITVLIVGISFVVNGAVFQEQVIGTATLIGTFISFYALGLAAMGRLGLELKFKRRDLASQN